MTVVWQGVAFSVLMTARKCWVGVCGCWTTGSMACKRQRRARWDTWSYRGRWGVGLVCWLAWKASVRNGLVSFSTRCFKIQQLLLTKLSRAWSWGMGESSRKRVRSVCQALIKFWSNLFSGKLLTFWKSKMPQRKLPSFLSSSKTRVIAQLRRQVRQCSISRKLENRSETWLYWKRKSKLVVRTFRVLTLVPSRRTRFCLTVIRSPFCDKIN